MRQAESNEAVKFCQRTEEKLTADQQNVPQNFTKTQSSMQ